MGRPGNLRLSEEGRSAFRHLVESVQINTSYGNLDKIAAELGISRVCLSNYLAGTRGVPWKHVATIILIEWVAYRGAKSEEDVFSRVEKDLKSIFEKELGKDAIRMYVEMQLVRFQEKFSYFVKREEKQKVTHLEFKLEDLQAIMPILEAIIKSKEEKTLTLQDVGKILEIHGCKT